MARGMESCPTGLPIHFQGAFAHTDNRRDIWLGDDLAGEALMKSDWNKGMRASIGDLYAKGLAPSMQNMWTYDPWPDPGWSGPPRRWATRSLSSRLRGVKSLAAGRQKKKRVGHPPHRRCERFVGHVSIDEDRFTATLRCIACDVLTDIVVRVYP